MSRGAETIIDRYSDAWNRHDVDAIVALHTEDSVFENHTSGGIAVGKAEIRKLIEGVFATFPDLRFATRRAYLREDVPASWSHERRTTAAGTRMGAACARARASLATKEEIRSRT